jgi:hypothetical protein
LYMGHRPCQAGFNSILTGIALYEAGANNVRPSTAVGRRADGCGTLASTLKLGGKMQPEMNDGQGSNANKIWIGIAVGAAVGIGIALSRSRKRSHWDSAREVTRRITDRSGDVADATRDIVDRVKTIYEESRKVVEEAGELWAHGRKMVGY